MALISSVCALGFLFLLKERGLATQNQCRTMLDQVGGVRAIYTRKPGEHTWQAVWICALSPKWARLPFAEVCKPGTGCPPRHKAGLCGLGAGMRRKVKVTKHQTKLLLHVSLTPPSGGTRGRDSPVQVLDVASEAPGSSPLWIRVTDPVLAPNSVIH